MLRKGLLLCGVAASLFYAWMVMYLGRQWDGYSAASRVISELSAVDAPTRASWLLPGVIYTVLAIAFGAGVWIVSRGNRKLHVAGGLILASSLLGLLWPFAPMHLREVLAAGGATWQDTMHIALGAATVSLMLVAIGFAAGAFGPGFRAYSLTTLAVVFVFGVLTFIEAPGLSRNLPTPWIGVWERINIGAFMLWEAVLALELLRPRAIHGRT
jgi:hypothetical protein